MDSGRWSDNHWNDLRVILANVDARMRDDELAMCECDFDPECRYAMASRMIREWPRQPVE